MDVSGLSYKVHICSNNNFPTAAGLASSAAGYACLGKPKDAKLHISQFYISNVMQKSLLPLSQTLVCICILFFSLHTGKVVWSRGGVVLRGEAGFRQCLPEHVWGLCPVEDGREGRWQRQSSGAGGARDPLAGTQSAGPGGKFYSIPFYSITLSTLLSQSDLSLFRFRVIK